MKRIGLFCTAIFMSGSVIASAASPEIQKGDHVSFIGNALADRMQHVGWLETLLQARFPENELVIRDLGFAGDELNTRPRSSGFGTPDEHLSKNKTDVVFAFFGYNESFAGPDGVARFKMNLSDFIRKTQAQKYNGRTAPRLVLFSPIAHEDLHDRNMPDGKANNERLKLYAQAMSEVAQANNIVFVDLFGPSQELYAASKQPLTINGVHLNEHGDKLIAQTIDKVLFGGAAQPARSDAQWESLRQAVLDKNLLFFNDYRTTDGYSIFGGRADLKFTDGQSNRDVMKREFEVLRQMTTNRDKRIWSLAQGKDVPVDDGNLPPFIPVVSNLKGKGPDGAHIFLDGVDAVKQMTVGKGLAINLFASEKDFPELVNPVQMSFDNKGRLWVAAWAMYPHWKPGTPMDDKLLILEDTDGDGHADKCKVFAGGLNCPTGFEFYNGGVYIAQVPDIMFLKDTDGDDKADVRIRVLDGMDSADTHHSSNSFVLDPGGALYWQEGTFMRTQVESPYGPPERCADAGVFRYEPRTQKFETYITYKFANPHGHVFDRWGQDFVTDGTNADQYYAAGFSGHLDYPAKHPDMQKWFAKRTRPCPGTEILTSRQFPDEFQGNFLVGNVIGFQGILRYKFNEQDSGFTGTELDPIVRSTDPNFRPSDFEIGPDGAIYFTDWQNPLIGHMQHNLRDPNRDQAHGRVYRVRYVDRPLLTPPQIAGQPIEKLLDLLKEPEDRVRYRAKIELSARDSDQVVAAVKKWITTLDRNDADYEHQLLEGLWVHQHHNIVNADLLKRMLRSPEYHARAAATRVLCYWRDRLPDALDLLKVQADDAHPRVRLEAVRAASFFRDPKAAEVALVSLKHPSDYYLGYTLKETMKQLEPFWRPAVQRGVALAADNPAGMSYLLGNVTTAELLQLPWSVLVCQALLARHDIVEQYRKEALTKLAELNKTDEVTELLAAMRRLDERQDAMAEHTLHDLGWLLVSQPKAGLRARDTQIEDLAEGAQRAYTRQVAYVALITSDGSIDKTWKRAEKRVETLEDVLLTVPLLDNDALRASAHDRIVPLIMLPPELAAGAQTEKGVTGRYVRIDLPRRGALALSEIQVFSGGANIAKSGTARQSSTVTGGDAANALDGATAGNAAQTRANDNSPWWELDLGSDQPIDSISIWVPTGANASAAQLNGYQLTVLNAQRGETFKRTDQPAPTERARFDLGGDPVGRIRRAAIAALPWTGRDEEKTFKTLAGLIRSGDQRDAAVKSISKVRNWPQSELSPLIDAIAGFVGKLPVAERASPEVRDALQLGNDLAARLPQRQAQEARQRLRELGVPVIVLHAVPHQMVYDKQHVYVEAGKPIEIVFENNDIMPHNLIITSPGMLEKVGIEAEKMAADPKAFDKGFVPTMPQVLHATKLLQPGESDRIAFTAPAELGEYPYVCTFPGHWRRMYGTLHVVKSLDDVPPEALVATTAIDTSHGPVRSFVRAWTLDDLSVDLAHAEHADRKKGKELFASLACVQCHQMKGIGGQAGPDLVGVKQKLADNKMTLEAVLTEILEPSKVIDDKYRTQVLTLKSGKVLSGVVVREQDGKLFVSVNPLDQQNSKPVEIAIGDIDDRIPSAVSLMPQGLLNTASKEEILDLLGYVLSGGE